jgi:hypothetical protein
LSDRFGGRQARTNEAEVPGSSFRPSLT